MNKVLVPIDFSDDSSHALDFAIALNEHYQAKILLLHVLDSNDSDKKGVRFKEGAPVEDLFTHDQLVEVKNNLKDWIERITKAGHQADYLLKVGNTFKRISATIAEERATLIIMSSHGKSGLKEILRGSHAEQVIRFAECPVLTVKGSTNVKDINEMVFASDLSDEQHVIVEKAKSFQQMLGEIPMHILFVRTRRSSSVVRESEAMEDMEAFVSKHELSNITLNTVEADYTYEGIMDFAHSKKAGLVVMGTHGNKGIAHILVGSRAEELIHHSDIPVLTYKIFH